MILLNANSHITLAASIASAGVDVCPSSLQSLTKDRKPGSLCFRGERTVWLQPDTLDEFLQLKWEHPSARVVVGNTEVGQWFTLTHTGWNPSSRRAVAVLSYAVFTFRY